MLNYEELKTMKFTINENGKHFCGANRSDGKVGDVVKFIKLTKNDLFQVQFIKGHYLDTVSDRLFSVPKKALTPIIHIKKAKRFKHHLKYIMEQGENYGFIMSLADEQIDNVMRWYNFFEECHSEETNRCLTKKAVRLGYEGICKKLGIDETENRLKKLENKEKRKKENESLTELPLLFKLAEKYNYELIDKNLWMDE